jgi:hypothetical protein
MITDYRGRVVGEYASAGTSAWVAGTIDVEALRHFRATSRWSNWMKDLTTEQYRLIYDEPVFPRNLYLERKPLKHAEYHEEVAAAGVQRLTERGVYAEPDRRVGADNGVPAGARDGRA